MPLLTKLFNKTCAKRYLNYNSLTLSVVPLRGHTTSKGLYFCRPSYPALQESHVRQPRCCCPTCPTLHPCEPFLTTVLSILQHSSQGKSLKKKGFIAHAPTNTSAKCNLKRNSRNYSTFAKHVVHDEEHLSGQRSNEDKVRTHCHPTNASTSYYAHPSRGNRAKRRYNALN